MIVSEFEIIKGCKAGKHKSQRCLYERYSKKMLGVCLRYCHSKEDAEDVLQEGFIKVFSNIDTFKEEGSFEGWIRRIMINTALNNYQSNLKRYYQADISEELEIVADNPDAFARLSATELLTLVQSMPLGYRMVFNMFAIEGYSHKEIGDMLDISENTSKSQLSRARVYLQKKIEDLAQVEYKPINLIPATA